MSPPMQLQLLAIVNKGQSCQLDLGYGRDKTASLAKELHFFKAPEKEFNVIH